LALSIAKAQTKSEPGKFFLGADISALDAPTRIPLPAYHEEGGPSDELSILAHHGWNAFRVRVFVSPVRNAPNNSLENAIPLAKRIKASGATLILDLYFSDTWADPHHQDIPVAWRMMDINTLSKQWESYARDTIKTFKDAGAMPDIVQIGNEITRGTAWPLAQIQIPGSNQYNPPEPYNEVEQWNNLTLLLNAGIRGVKDGAGRTSPRIAIHIDQGGNWNTTQWFFDHLEAAHVRYDIIVESFSPPLGHGTLDGLLNNMTQCGQRYRKDFLITETGFLPSPVANDSDTLWPDTPEGRLQLLVDLVNTVENSPHGLGVLYWSPERDLWNADGSAGPAVYALDKLSSLAKRPESHAPTAVKP
jgi:arabinogalactan endo-1,4-beta-galactosidase